MTPPIATSAHPLTQEPILEPLAVPQTPGFPVDASKPSIPGNRRPIVRDNGKTFFLSARESHLIDIFSKTQNYSEAAKSLAAKFNAKTGLVTVKRWLNRPHVQAHLQEVWRDMGVFEGWTKERYVRVCDDYAAGRKVSGKQTPIFLKLLGQAKGFFEETRGGVQNNIQIKFTQQNGEE